MIESIEVFPIGAAVLLDGGVVTATVTAIFIRSNQAAYEVVWWNDRERKVEIVEEWEIQSDDCEKSQRVCPIL